MKLSIPVHVSLIVLCLLVWCLEPALAQVIETEVTIGSPTGSHRPLHSVDQRPGAPFYVKPSIEIPNFAARKDGNGANTLNTNPGGESPAGGGGDVQGPAVLDQDPLLGPFNPTVVPETLTQFQGADNNDNFALLGFGVNPPDTVIDVGPNHIVEMINLVTRMYAKDGTLLRGPEPHTALFANTNHDCEDNTKASGDPVVIYDDQADRWILTYFAFSRDPFFGIPTAPFYQCVAASQTPDPTGAYYRYAFDLSPLGGLNDYPKFGITEDAITMTAHLFSFNILLGASYEGQFVGAINKSTLYAGQPTQMVGLNLGEFVEGALPADIDGSAVGIPELFATAMNAPGFFDIYKMTPNFGTANPPTVDLISSIPIAAFDLDLCTAERERCVPHSGTGPDLETLGDRLMHRLQIRKFGTHASMTAALTVDADVAPAGTPGRAGIRWYEMRSLDGGENWALHQEGTFAPDDGRHRWMPSLAMNAAGDIGIGYMVSDATMAPELRYTGQTAASSGSGAFDTFEGICQIGLFGADWSGRSGDYGSTNIDPLTDTFWHAGQFGSTPSAGGWGTAICEFQLGSGPVNQAPEVTITSPADGSSFDSGTSVSFTGTANDPEDGDVTASLSWTSNLDGTIGSGGSFSTTSLSVGTHTITASVTDSGGLPGSDVITVSIDPVSTASSLHVEDIVTGSEIVNGRNSRGTATVTIRDNLDNPVEGATVTGTFSGNIDEIASAITDSSGVATLATLGTTRSRNPTVDFCVNTVADTLPYDSSGNASPTFDCGGGGSGTPPTDVHVDSVATGQQGAGGGQKHGRASVTILDDQGNPAVGYTVTGDFSGDFEETGVSAVTDGSGVATLLTSGTKSGKVNVDFCVSNVAGLLPYDSSANSGSFACSP